MSNEKEKQIREILFSQNRADNQMGIIQTITDDDIFPLRRPGTLKEFRLSQKFGFPYSADNIKFLPDNDDRIIVEDLIVLGFEQCKRKDQKKEIKKTTDPKYDEPGIISFYAGHQTINISVTQRELIEAFLNPEKLKWKSLEQIKAQETQISSKDIALATKSRIPDFILDAVGKTFEKFREVTSKIVDKIKVNEDEGR